MKKFRLKKTKRFKYATICSGIEAPSVAWKDLGWEAQWFSEIEDFPSAVLKHHYPNVPNLGDMTKLTENKIFQESEIDLIIGGTPCFSSNTLVVTDKGLVPISEIRVGDNVYTHQIGAYGNGESSSTVKARDYKDATDLVVMGVSTRSQGLANGNNCSPTLSATDYKEPMAVVYENHPADSRAKEVKDNVCPTVTSRWGAGGGNVPFVQSIADEAVSYRTNSKGDCFEHKESTSALTTNTDPCTNILLDKSVAFAQNSRDEVRLIGGDGQSVGALCAEPGMKQQSFVAEKSYSIRRLTPTETERLQGFPDSYANIPYKKKPDSPDSCRYKAIGNSMAVPVIRWIGERIAKLERGEL